MRITAIIPTLNRPKPLEELLRSILANTRVPEETIVVDQSDSEDTAALVREIGPAFEAVGASLEYYWRRQKSLTAARNHGVAQARGDLISFFDDDLILSREYFEAVESIFVANPEVKGVQGFIVNDSKRGRVSNLARKFFFADHVGKEFRIIPSFHAQVMDPDLVRRMRVVHSDFLNGVSTYRRDVFERFSFDEKLTKYSLGEDRDFSYRVGKEYPGSLVVAGNAEVIHMHSGEGRLASRDYLFMQAAHSLYLFSKNIRPTVANKSAFWWHWVGRALVGIAQCAGAGPSSWQNIKDLLGSVAFMTRHYREFARGDLRPLYAELKLPGEVEGVSQ